MTATTTTTPAARRTTRTRKAAPAKAAQNPVAEVQIPTTREAKGYTVDLQAQGEVNDSRNYDKLMDKAPNEIHVDFVAWVKESTEYDADPKTVQLVLALYSEYQRSPQSRARTQARRTTAATKRAEAEAKKVQRLREAAAKLAKIEAEAAKTASK